MKWLFLLIACAAFSSACAQGINDKFSYYDEQWKPAPMKKGDYMQRLRKVNDTTYLRTTYHTPGPRISQLRSKDEAGKTLHGFCVYYRTSGELDSIGEYRNGIMNGPWYFYDETGMPFKRKDYENGRFIKDSLFTIPTQDSLKRIAPVPGEVASAFAGGAKGWDGFSFRQLRIPATGTEIQHTGYGCAVLQGR